MWQTVITSLKGMLADSGDATMLSSKRVIALLAFIAIMVSYFVDQFTTHKVTKDLFDGLMWIVIAGLGFTGIEKFAPKD